MNDSVLIMLILGVLVAGTLIGILVLSIPMAAIVYVWKNVYPLVKRIAKWSARLENLISLVVPTVILFFLIILGFSVFPLIIVLIIVPLVLLVPIGLGVLVWIIRLARRVYARWRIWLIVTYLRLRTRSSNSGPARIARNRIARNRITRKM